MLIGELAERSGFSRDTIRYYEKRGLLDGREHRRQANNYRDYSEQALRRLLCIGQLKEHGFTLGEIRGFLELQESIDACEGVPEQLQEKLDRVERQIEQLQLFRQRLRSALSQCEGATCDLRRPDQRTFSNEQ